VRSCVGEKIGMVEIFMGFWGVKELRKSLLFFFYHYFSNFVLFVCFIILFLLFKKTLTDEKEI